MKENMKRLLSELLKDSKRSDGELARVLGVSQPTITKMRKQLIEEGIIQGFTVIPDLAKIGYEIMAVTVATAKQTLTPDEQEKAKKLVLENPQVIFVASGVGLGGNGVMISLHKNHSEYLDFMNKLWFETGNYIEKADSMLINLRLSMIVKPLSLANLAIDRYRT